MMNLRPGHVIEETNREGNARGEFKRAVALSSVCRI
jgi:hypothetical protein